MICPDRRGNKIKKGIMLLTILSIFSSCSQPIVNTAQNNQTNLKLNTIKSRTSIITGIVEFPKSSKINVKAAFTDFVSASTVSLINPVNNTTIASGLTDANGLFIINPGSLSAFDGQIFILEASKRLEGGAIGKGLSSIRTYVKWNNGSTTWTSISTPLIKINVSTTALSIIEGLDNSVNPNDVIDKINSSGAFIPFGNITSGKMAEVEELINEVLIDQYRELKNIT